MEEVMANEFDSNLAALRIHEQEQEQAVKLYDDAERLYDALEIIHDGKALKKHLNDEFLAIHLGEALAGLEHASKEIAALPKEACPITKMVLRRLRRIEMALFNYVRERM
jgi:hypothetical protein